MVELMKQLIAEGKHLDPIINQLKRTEWHIRSLRRRAEIAKAFQGEGPEEGEQWKAGAV